MRRDSNPPLPPHDSLVSAIMGYNKYDLSSKKEVKWGVDHEGVARKAYIQEMAASHKNFTCRLVGFVVDGKKNPSLVLQLMALQHVTVMVKGLLK